MRSDIIFGQLPPASRLRMEELRTRYGVSVPTLREALSRLASEGLAVAEDQRGFAVAPISEANLRELAALRMLIELHALERSFQVGDVEWSSRVVAAHHKLSRIEQRMIAGDPCDRIEWKRYDSGFHHALIMGCGSAELLAVHGSVFDRYLRYQMVYLTFRGQIAADEHQALLEAALERDVARGKEVLVRHIEGGVEHALRAHAAQRA
ncbi:MAG: GntR family transcriptional regulator [Alphaproteobacteria bacterium HGW-Alphaproteobacteria-4]|jgi:DNA-binding GntR family transcriptional regulator|nr:MAG: GntR family transcriptional regulator [Alphaproteobacteria bacterium HGW-Alphaproteobacteria-4]